MTKKSFFKSEDERQLWIRLNAERIQYSHKVLNGIDEGLGDIDTQYSHMWISNNQLIYDEHNCDAPRFSFEELLTLSQQQLLRLNEDRNKEIIRKMFETCKNSSNDTNKNVD